MKRRFFYFIILAISFLVPFYGAFAISSPDSIQVGLEVNSSCGNGSCEPNLGETVASCPTDCSECNHNGVCEANKGENNGNCPSDCPWRGAGPLVVPDTTPPTIFSLFISQITLNSVKISWETNEGAVCQLLLGITEEYKKETIVETIFSLRHSIEIIDLSPATPYYFKVVCRDISGNESETQNQKFTTLVPLDTISPANIINFKAVAGDKHITLTWQNPKDVDFKGVKIIRSEKFYPISQWEEAVVYNDKEGYFVDRGLNNGVRYYYTAFAYDKSGNYASGAIASAVPQAVVIPPVVPPVTPPIVPAPPEIEKLTLRDFDFIQDGQKIPVIDNRIVKAKPEDPLTVSINSKKIPITFKIIIITFEGETNSYSFLMQINQERTAYEADIIFPKTGIYPFNIDVLNFQKQIIKKIDGEFQIEKIRVSILPGVPWYEKPANWIFMIIILIGLLLLAYLLKKIRDKITKTNDTNGDKRKSIKNL